MAATAAADGTSKQHDRPDADAAGCLTPKSTDTLVHDDDSKETSTKNEKKLDPDTTSEAEAEKKDPILVQVERPGYARSIRTRSKTGRKYEIETQGLWTRIRSLTPQIKKRSLKERLRKRIKDFRTFWPFVLRFATQVLKLGKWRFFFHLIASTIAGLAPALRIYLSSRLIAIAQTAADKRILRKGELFTVALTSYLSGFLETWIDGLLADNNGILTRRFESMVSEHLMQARARLDVHTLGKSRVTRDFSSAASLMHALGDGSFVIGQVIDLFTSAVSLITQGSMLWSMTTAENADVATISLFSAGLMILRWFGRSYFHTTSGITDANYNRMSQMESLSHPQMDTFGERKVLGLGDWVLQEYKKASNALGDVSLAFPRRSDPLTTATEAIKTFSDTAIYVLFALKVSEKPLGVAAMSMSSLTFIQGAARGLAASLYRFVRDVQDFGSEFAAFRAYYRVLEIKTAIEEPAEPLEYKTQQHVLEDGTVRMGMDLEFKDVSFTWPGKKEKALDSISFKINAGELCAIVGYNGAGKSTLISLISRLCDPSSGQILINGQDIRHYSTKDLHNSMSLLFQDSAHMPLTLREFIGIGNLDEVDNIEKIRQAATESGAIDFIDKLEKGFESSFSGDGEMDTPESLYQQAAEWDEMFSDGEDEDEDKDEDDEPKSPKGESEKNAGENKEEDAKEGKEGDKKKDKDDDSDSDSDSDDEGGRLAFSGGQTQKLVMARNFMRSSDLSIFDEYSASLDPVAEHELFKRITRNRGKQTILYITHRYSTVRHADRILMLEKGKVTECGTHQELIAIPNGKYAEMCRLALGEGEESKDKPASGDEDGSEKTFVNEDDTMATKTPLPESRPESPTISKSL